MSDRFALAYSTLGCPDWTFEHAAEQAAANGYAALEVRLLNGEIIPADMSTEQRAAVRDTVARAGVQICGLGLSTRFSFADEKERKANLDLLHRYIDLAADLDVPMVRTFGGPLSDGVSLEQAVGYVAEALNAAAPAAEQAGVTILLETHDAFCKGADVAKVMAQVPSRNVAAVWDVHHPFRMGEDIETTWRVIGSRVKHVHIKDARLKPDGGWQLVLMGQGEVPCRGVIELLHREGYQGIVAAEWEKKWHPEIEEPEVAMPQHAQVLRQWMAALPAAARA
jgi:sugar phosphate isomerase/epimerase